MRSFVIFSVLNCNYGIDIESVKRILPAQELTDVPDVPSHILGMFQYEDNVLKTLGFRKAIGEDGYEEELNRLFPKLKAEQKAWLEALKHSIDTGSSFTKNSDPHKCQLGQWIDSFHPDNVEVLSLMKKLSHYNQSLHAVAMEALQKRTSSIEEAQELMNVNVNDLYNKTMEYLQKVSALSSKVAAELQRCLIIEDKDGNAFGINIDAVDDIVHIDETELHEVKEEQHLGDFMNVAAILMQENKLVTIIKDITLEKRSA